MPGWVSDGVRHYLAHTEDGQTIRALARRADVHASTVLRQVRRFEAKRDDPLVDRALRRLSRHCGLSEQGKQSGPPWEQREIGMKEPNKMMGDFSFGTIPEEGEIEREGLRILRRLAEQGTVLAVARDMDMAVVVRDGGEGEPPQRVAVVARPIAEAMALNDWIACGNPESRIARYRITGTGRGALKQLVAAAENRARGFSDGQVLFEGVSVDDPALRHMRSALAESPVTGLARRHDKDGHPFLNRDLVVAAERLREDFELSEFGTRNESDWEKALADTTTMSAQPPTRVSPGAQSARARVGAALGDLGPGLADVALRCCCLLEGLETMEQRMGWSARSGKIVLRIALQRLQQHYLRTQGRYGPMIG
jgi:hypothetical protein